MNLPNIDIDKILSHFSTRQKFYVWITFVAAIVFLGTAYFITEMAVSYFDNDNHTCVDCRKSLNDCNSDYARLADIVREYTDMKRQEQLSSLEIETEQPITLEPLEEIEKDIKQDSLLNEMRKMSITKWVEQQGKTN